MSEKMPRIFMPDPEQLPDGLTFSAGLVQQYMTLPAMYVSSWEAFGNGSSQDAPKIIQVEQVSGAERAHIANYAEWVSGLQSVYTDIGKLDGTVAGLAGQSPTLCDGGRKDLANAIEALKVMASVNPQDLASIKELIDAKVIDQSIAEQGGTISEDQYVMAIMVSASNTVSGIMQQKWEEFEKLGSKIRAEKPDETPQKAPAVTPATKTDVPSGPGNNFTFDNVGSVTPDSPAVSTAAAPVWNWNDSSPETAVSSPLAPTATSRNRSPSGGDAADTQSSRSSEVGPTPPAAAVSATPASPASPMSAPATAMANYALPMAVMAGLANRRPPAAETAPAQTMRPVAGSAVSGGAVAAPPPNSAPRVATGNASPAATSSPPSPSAGTGAPASGSPTAPGTPSSSHPPARGTAPVHAVAISRDDDGSTIFTFPDGRAQRVSLAVANALTVALGNAATTDGRSAYDSTPARIPEGKTLGTPTDPNDIATGDIASWENRTAIAVAFPADGGGTLEVIIEGRLCPFEPRMSDKHGDFGPFSGFFHPAGVEIPAAASGSGLSATPVDQSVNGPATVPA
ncbi:hypothetical protein [Nocardia sp. NRRL WC-3656]|uniref:hypothetical protein n=1 Tax=Nocardia sp. NRRL WC-3656 TaxID=1463824 RepID=UPI000A7E90D5|nr:hypothetical protein [Nocardia sp. NRRL WC-3656]